jgi:deoxyribodipyrimidine photo-lyase
MYAAGLMWFRRDLRVADNAALHYALRSCASLHCAFVFDTAILEAQPRADRRVEFIRESVAQLDAALRKLGGPSCGLLVLHGDARQALPALAAELGVKTVFANRDHEQPAKERDAFVQHELRQAGIAFHTFKDQTVFEGGEILTQSGTPYSVFTPYSRAWLAKVDAADLQAHDTGGLAAKLAPRPAARQREVPALHELGFEATNLQALGILPGADGGARTLAAFLPRLAHYHAQRDFPMLNGPSYLGVHLRFGTVSIRELVRLARSDASEGAATWLKELVWREFYAQVLANFPHVSDARGESHSFKPEYDRIAWEQGPLADERFAAWCEGRTGYPLVDAAMAQIHRTGYMHNRLRMIVASFLTKDLGIDWRWGERYFARHLNDFELASNNGGWQWAASSGCDAQPYFRIFNPVSQSRKFDPDGAFIRHYLPQLAHLPTEALHAPWLASPIELQAAGVRLGVDYPLPIVDHAQAREETLRRYAVVKTGSPGSPPSRG